MKSIPASPEAALRCLLIQPPFNAFSFWNYRDTCALVGAKTPAPPLGLLTVAALLPQNWKFELVDMNCVPSFENQWNQADLICVGGMLPQQRGILEIIQKANADGKYVVVGGADPSSQPELYSEADALVLGEGEITIPLWLDSWRNGKPTGTFQSDTRPDVTKSPIPRFDLLHFDDYLQIAVQYSRGCPFNCEFCDIIELYGRVPRTKTAPQLLAELETLQKLGYRGAVDLVDDNFIGNKRNVKRMLPELVAWQRRQRYPFFFSTEASMNLADDPLLLSMMQDAEFRFVFLGIETPDPEVLRATQKSQNTMKPIVQRVHTIQEYGMVVVGGFIIGFDHEKPDMDIAMINCIEETGICMSMVGLLSALPNTQLTRRLSREGRLMSFQGKRLAPGERVAAARVDSSIWDIVDQTCSGLNFVTLRDRITILAEHARIVKTVFSPKAYFHRVLRTAQSTRIKLQRIPRWHELGRYLRGMVKQTRILSRNPAARRLYWSNVLRTFFMGPMRFGVAMVLMAMYIHYEKQCRFLLASIVRQIKHFSADGHPIPRKLADRATTTDRVEPPQQRRLHAS